jgi:hypothetical protein
VSITAEEAIVILKAMPNPYRERVEEMIGAAMEAQESTSELYGDVRNIAEPWRRIARGEYRK